MMRLTVRWFGVRLIQVGRSRRPLSTALVVACTLSISPQPVSKAAADEKPAAAKSAAEKQFDQTFFDRRRDPTLEAAEARLKRILKARIAAIDRACGLAEAQRAKLELAGQGAIIRFLENFAEQKRQFLAEPRDELAVTRHLFDSPAIVELRRKLRNGPFEEESAFATAVAKLLTAEQAAKYSNRIARAKTSNRTIAAENVGDLVRIAKLRKDVYQVEFNRAGTYVGFLEYNKQLDIYRPLADEPVRTLGRGKGAFGFDFSRDGELVAEVDDSDSATILNISDGKEVWIPIDEKQFSVRFSPDGKTLVAAGYGTKAHLWSIATGERVREFALGPQAGGLTPVFSPDGKLLAIGNRNSTTGLFDVASGKLLHTLPHAKSQQLSFDPTGQTLAVVYVNGQLVLWDVQTGTEKKRVQAWANELFTVAWTPDGSMLATGGHNAPLTFWNAADLSIAGEFESPERVLCARFSPDGTKLIFAGWGPSAESRYVETWAVP